MRVRKRFRGREAMGDFRSALLGCCHVFEYSWPTTSPQSKILADGSLVIEAIWLLAKTKFRRRSSPLSGNFETRSISHLENRGHVVAAVTVCRLSLISHNTEAMLRMVCSFPVGSLAYQLGVAPTGATPYYTGNPHSLMLCLCQQRFLTDLVTWSRPADASTLTEHTTRAAYGEKHANGCTERIAHRPYVTARDGATCSVLGCRIIFDMRLSSVA